MPRGIPSQFPPENLKSICFPRLADLSSFWPTRFSRSAPMFIPRKTYFPGCKLRSIMSWPRPGFHCLRNHSTSASSGIEQVTWLNDVVDWKHGILLDCTNWKPVLRLASCAKFIHGESDHCRERLR